jgi:demethylmenaquinone methyltransferase/2-methoxy-6-polyprenyl-1,4-benzoquinol methylase
MMAALNKKDISALYRKRARRYNFTANLYYLIGFREYAFRKKAVDALNLKNGDTVVEIGCGTGLNFSLLQNAVGPEGKIIGVDLTEEMLEKAKNRIKNRGWNNVELVHSDAAQFQFPDGIDGVISTFAITLIPEFDEVIRNGCQSLKKGKRLVVLDLKMPSNWLSYLAPLYILITKSFGVTKDLMERHPWESINKYLINTSLTELYKGVGYIAVGEKAG